MTVPDRPNAKRSLDACGLSGKRTLVLGASGYVTGQVLFADGGLTVHL